MHRRFKNLSCGALAVLLCLQGMPFEVSADSGEDTTFQIKIAHTNDIHARVSEEKGIIGAERLKTMIDAWSSDGDMDLVVDSGDLFHGQPIATLVKGESIAKIAQLLGYDVMTAGNHDWSYGKDRLKELCDMAGVQMLCGNVKTENQDPFFEQEYYVEEVSKNGETLKVGMFGEIDPELYHSTTPANVEGLTFTDSVAYAKQAVEQLKEEGCDIVIGLAHTNDPQEIAAQVDDVNLWLCGHEHVDRNTTVSTPNGGTAYVVESGYYLNEVSLMELDCTLDENGELKEVAFERQVVTAENADTYEKDASVTALLEDINQEQEEVLKTVVGKTPEDLDGDWYHLRIDETNLGRVVADAYLLATGADAAFENAGGIRASVAAGSVTYGDIIGVSPYGNYIVTKQITGKELLEILETSIEIQRQCIEAYERGEDDAWPSSSGSYLQFGGIEVLYDLDGPEGNRVLKVTVGEKPLDEKQVYTVATNNYAAVSGYYPQLANAGEIGQFCACDEALVAYFKQGEEAVAKTLDASAMIPVENCPHKDTEIRDGKEATCTEEGYTGDTWCKDCEKVVEPGKTIDKKEHQYEQGKCTVCGIKDPTQKQEEEKKPEENKKPTGNKEQEKKQDTTKTTQKKTNTDKKADNAKTGDANHPEAYVLLLLLSGIVLTVNWKKRKSV